MGDNVRIPMFPIKRLTLKAHGKYESKQNVLEDLVLVFNNHLFAEHELPGYLSWLSKPDNMAI